MANKLEIHEEEDVKSIILMMMIGVALSWFGMQPCGACLLCYEAIQFRAKSSEKMGFGYEAGLCEYYMAFYCWPCFLSKENWNVTTKCGTEVVEGE